MKPKNDLRLFAQIIEAQPGYYALDLYGEFKRGADLNTPIYVHKEPVIAWLVEVERNEDVPRNFLYPICQNNLSDLYQGAILRPDGKVVIRGVGRWECFDHYRAHVVSTERNVWTAVSNKREALYNAR